MPELLGKAAAATLVVVAVEEDAGGILPGTILLGLPIIRRVALAARRSGFDRVLVIGNGTGREMGQGALADTGATSLALGGSPPDLPPGRVLITSARLLPTVAWLQALRVMPLEPDVVYVDAPSVALVETSRPREVVAAVARHAPRAALSELAWPFTTVPGRLRTADVLELRSAADLATAERWLLRSLLKASDGFMSRHIDRRLSLAITRRLAATRVSPNVMTGISVGVGLVGGGFFLPSQPSAHLVGALLLWLHSVLDGCDGELARLRFEESRWGGALDFWGDNVVHVVVFGCMAIGWSLAVGGLWPLLAGASAICGTLLSATFVYRTTMTEDREGPLFTSIARSPATHVTRAADFLARRDFIYLVVLLAALGKAYWFLSLAAVGAPAFFAVLLWVTFWSRRRHGARAGPT